MRTRTTRRTLNLLILLVAALTATAQSIERQVIATAGGSFSAGGTQLTTTVGEAVIDDGAAGTVELTQGFLQGTTGTATATRDAPAELAYTIHPNPATDRVTVSIDDAHTLGDQVRMNLVDATGRTVRSTSVRTARTELDVRSLDVGTYTVVLRAGAETRSVDQVVIAR